MDITYKPYIRDSSFKELSIKSPTINIKGYKPKYTIKQDKEETITPVESPIEEIQMHKKPKIKEATAKAIRFESKEEFKDTMIPIYESLLVKRGLNPVFAKALVAQDGLESAWGSKPSGNFNFGGIKGKGAIKRTREVINGKDVYINDSFRDFNSLEDYANFKIDLLNSNRYNAFSGNISEFADRVQKGGYATDPNYSRTLNKVIATAKYGGTLKLQLGGVVQGKQWVKNWYKNRTFQIKRNIQQHQLIPIPVTGALGYNILAHNIDLTTASIDPSRVPTDSKGVYSYLYIKLGLKIPKYQHSGVLRNAYNDPEHYYDYSKGSYDPDTEHWSGRDPVTGMELKNPNHPTAFMHHEVEQQLGNKRYQDSNGRYYTFPNGEAPIWRNVYGPLSETPGLKEVKYPSYGKGKASVEEAIKDNLPRVQWIWDQLISAGASKEQAAAILGNFWKENQIQPYGKPSSKGAMGLAQLKEGRYDRYIEFLNKNKLIDSTESQIKYLLPIIFTDEVNPHNLDNYNSFWNDWTKSQREAFRTAKGLDDLTVSFADNFERMGKKEADYETRINAARYIYNLMVK